MHCLIEHLQDTRVSGTDAGGWPTTCTMMQQDDNAVCMLHTWRQARYVCANMHGAGVSDPAGLHTSS